MRTLACLGVVVGLALAAGCDTTQPLQVEDQTATLDFRAVSARVAAVNTWRIFEDSDPRDGEPDDVNGDGEADFTLWCDPAPGVVNAVSVPWSYSAQVDIIPAGEVVPITIARSLSAGDSFAQYDTGFASQSGLKCLPGTCGSGIAGCTVIQPRGQCRQNPAVRCNPEFDFQTGFCAANNAGVCGRVGTCTGDPSVECKPDNPFATTCEELDLGTCDVPTVERYFCFPVPGRTLSQANSDVMSTESNLFYDASPPEAEAQSPPATPANLKGGLCPGNDLGPSNLDGNPLPWSFPVKKGDTIVVTARRFEEEPPGITFQSEPAISATLALDGVPANVRCPDPTNCTSTGTDAESFISFFFTLK